MVIGPAAASENRDRPCRLGHSTVIVAMHYTHTNLDSKKAAVAKLESFGDNLVTICTKDAAIDSTIGTKRPAKSCCKLYLKTEEWVSG